MKKFVKTKSINAIALAIVCIYLMGCSNRAQMTADADIDAEISKTLKLDKEEKIESADWVDEEKSLYHIAVGRTVETVSEYMHLEDYFYTKEDGKVVSLTVDYPSKTSPLDSDRYVYEACDFGVEYVDVNFDGHNDIVISLGSQGSSGVEVHCAYVFEDGGFIYKKSFEEIPNYSVDENEKVIIGSYNHGYDEHIDVKYEYKDREYVLVSEETVSNNDLGSVYANRYSKADQLFVSEESDFYDNMALATVDTWITVANEDNSPETVSKIWNERIKTATESIKTGKADKDIQDKLDEILVAWDKYDEEIILMDKGLYGTNGIVPGSVYKDMLIDYMATEYELIGGAFLSWEYESLGNNSMNLSALSEETELSGVNWNDFSDKSIVMEYDEDFKDILEEYNLGSADDKEYYSLSKELCSELDEITGSKLGYEQYVDDYYALIGSMADYEESISDAETADTIKTVRMRNLFLKLLNAKYLISCGNVIQATGNGVKVDESVFPDKIFRGYISESVDTDKDGFQEQYLRAA